uniref:MULE transposase domain-containing protein n=1 Tax=Plectus sambesii TaxID=2011161 RepID=A0A914VZZ1_9BILA
MLQHDLPELIGYYHEDDHISVDMAINKFTELGENNSIFYYRPQTAKRDTFALGMQTTTQLRLLEKFGSNVVCIATAHKTCCYDGYLLDTVLVLDSVGAGQPVAFFLTKVKMVGLPAMRRFIKYFEKVWLKDDEWIALWNHFTNEGARTTNAVEGYHSMIKKNFSGIHPKIGNY